MKKLVFLVCILCILGLALSEQGVGVEQRVRLIEECDSLPCDSGIMIIDTYYLGEFESSDSFVYYNY